MSINKVLLIGRLGVDPVLKSTASGESVVNFSLATSESWKDRDGKKQQKTEWHKIVIWGKLAEVCEEYLSKGDQIYLEGKLQTRSWKDSKTDETKYITEIVGSNVDFLETKKTQEKQSTEPESHTWQGSRIPAKQMSEEDIPF